MHVELCIYTMYICTLANSFMQWICILCYFFVICGKSEYNSLLGSLSMLSVRQDYLPNGQNIKGNISNNNNVNGSSTKIENDSM